MDYPRQQCSNCANAITWSSQEVRWVHTDAGCNEPRPKHREVVRTANIGIDAGEK